MANVAAQVALVHDLLGDQYSEDETKAVAQGLSRLHFQPFMDATAEKPEWWFRPSCESNWKIMTCGETGLAVLGFLEPWPDSNEALARAAQAVLEILDRVPAEGDWPEGVNYWFGTLWMGLRFARALRRLSRGEIDLFKHPALKVTGDFPLMLTTPAGRIYNFNDNDPKLGGSCAEALAMLAVEHRRGDWMAIAREAASDSLLFLACDDPLVASEWPSKTVGVFPRTGVVTFRSGWQRSDAFVGFKSGPSNVGHSHLDANSFVLEAQGQPLLTDQAYWPQAHFLGFFDSARHRWNFDGQATVGHSTLLVDGQGQTWGEHCRARIVEARDERRFAAVTGDASLCYPGLLRKFVRTLLFLKPDTLIIRDVIQCEGERSVEWLLQYAGTIRTEGLTSVIENGSVRLTVVPFLPDRHFGWRRSDVERTSVYECSDTRKEVTRSVRFRSFSTFRKAESFEFLFGFRINGQETAENWQFEVAEGSWRLWVRDRGALVQPDGESLRIVLSADAQE
jgi:hypothetical protein